MAIAPTRVTWSASTAVRLLALTIGALALLLIASAPAQAKATAESAKASKAAKSKAKKRQAQRRRAQRRHVRMLRVRRAQRRRANLASNFALTRRPATHRSKPKAVRPTGEDLLDAGFENGLDNWNTAGVGDVIPTVANDTVRSGAAAGKFVLSGEQDRSELILGGDGDGNAEETIQFDEGEEGYYAFSFYIESMVYGEPGGHNLIMQFKGSDDGSPNFGLQLWDYEGDDGGRGLWSHSDAMDGDRFLAPVPERQWHDILIHFKVSRADAGFYELFLNGRLIDSRSGVSIIPEDADYVYIKNGIYRNGDEVSGTSVLRLDAARLGSDASSVAPS